MKLINYFYKKFINTSLKRKLILTYILLVFTPILAVGFILTGSMRQMAMDSAIDEATVNVERLLKRVWDIMDNAAGISDRVYTSKQLELLLGREYSSVEEAVDAQRTFDDFYGYMQMNSEIRNIKFYTYNKTILNSGDFEFITPEIAASSWFKNAVKQRGKSVWTYMDDSSTENMTGLNMVRLVRNSAGAHLGVLAISLNMEYLYSVLKEEPFDTMIIDDENNIIAAKDRLAAGSKLCDKELEKCISQIEKGTVDITLNGMERKLVVNTFKLNEPDKKLKVVSIFLVRDIVKQANTVSLIGFGIIFASLLVVLGLIILLSNIMSDRFRRMSNEIHNVAMGNLDSICEVQGDDEIGQLSRDFNSMVKSLKQLVHEVYEINLQKKQLIIQQKEIKFQMLASQINPHFLFNSLETIRMRAHCNGQKEIAETVKLLGKLIRKTLEAGNEPVPLREEIELVKGYLEIQKFRFGEKVNYIVNLPSELENYRILPLLIQPVVENAIIHGLEPNGDIGMIIVNINTENEILTISVEDNGVGMDIDELNSLLAFLECQDDTARKNIGLRNIHQRIKLYYGNKYGIKIESKQDISTKISILLPEKIEKIERN